MMRSLKNSSKQVIFAGPDYNRIDQTSIRQRRSVAKWDNRRRKGHDPRQFGEYAVGYGVVGLMGR